MKQQILLDHWLAEAYAAGILDGEGTISIRKQRASPRGYNPTFYAWVSVYNTNQDVMRWLKARFGGQYRPRKHKPGHRTCYVWLVTGKSERLFLEAVYPYLIIKRRQADLAFRLYQLPAVPKARMGRKGWLIAPPSSVENKEIVRQEMLTLNWRNHGLMEHGDHDNPHLEPGGSQAVGGAGQEAAHGG